MLTGDESGFEEFVAARSHALFRSAFLLTGDHHLAQDLVQVALVGAAKHWERIHRSPDAYVRRILYNAHLSRFRRRRVAEVPLGEADGFVATSDPEAKLALDVALSRLTPKQRAVLILRFYEDLTEVQTAAVLGISSGTVKSTTRQALERLRTREAQLVDLIGDGR